ncbi:hypothetical protein K402DRAFT_391982 [Aulographum hederae CBS 113979]|uniref:Protein kinase domain-containing protein n=1 Tax=Aulographum hederae CBS 113979 TaxID=1176131 RepID=A0A6G1H5D9_9PEZI|nr:hypothetical protein K402DRAFT_391982 [Aulographum hederae CBS 113979]
MSEPDDIIYETNRKHPYYRKPIHKAGQEPPPLKCTPGGWEADLFGPGIVACEVEPGTVALIPRCIAERNGLGYSGYSDEEGPDDFDSDGDTDECSKTCIAYEKLGVDHESIVSYRGREPSNGLPLLAQPTGPTFHEFYNTQGENMWPPTLGHVAPQYLPLALSWVLQTLSAVIFVHSKEIFFGNLGTHICWLQEDLSIKIVGFVEAKFVNEYGDLAEASKHFGPWFQYSEEEEELGTVESDLHFWASLVYTFMTGLDVDESPERLQEGEKTIPKLPAELMGEILTKCWNAQYSSASEAMQDVEAFLVAHGFQVERNKVSRAAPNHNMDESMAQLSLRGSGAQG